MKKTLNILFVSTLLIAIGSPKDARAENTFCNIYVPAMTAGAIISMIAMKGPAARTSTQIYLASMLPCLFTVAYAQEVLTDPDKAITKHGPYTALVENVGRNDAIYIMEMTAQGASPDEIAKEISKLVGPEDNMF